jgi:hypothetical protein
MNSPQVALRRRVLRRVELLESRAMLAGVPFSFTVDDPEGHFAPFPALVDVLEAAGEILTGLLQGKGSLEVRVVANNDISYARAGATAVSLVDPVAGFTVVENGTLAEAKTGTDPNGAEADILVELNTETYLPTVFFDPSGAARTATLPADKEDFLSTALHELVHALGFQGYRTIFGADYGEFTIEFPAGSGKFLASSYDVLTQFGSGDQADILFFTGAKAQAAYGGPVPLTSLGPDDATGENFFHLGNPMGSVGADLIPDLMNGIVFFPGTRYVVGDLDLAVLADLGWTLAPTGGASWHNADLPSDVNGDGLTTVPDLLPIVTALRDNSGMPVALTFDPPTPRMYLDVTNDGLASVADLLAVVSVLRDQIEEGDGESPAEALGSLEAGLPFDLKVCSAAHDAIEEAIALIAPQLHLRRRLTRIG